jgi:hypothetical protein
MISWSANRRIVGPGTVWKASRTFLEKRFALTRTGRITDEDVKLYLEKARAVGLFPPEILRSRPIGELLCELEREHLVQLHADRAGNLEEIARAGSVIP